jgi:hypothetical protein
MANIEPEKIILKKDPKAEIPPMISPQGMARQAWGLGPMALKIKHPVKKAVFYLGRFQPPHNGHIDRIKEMVEIAASEGMDPFLFTTETKDKNRNPLILQDKINTLFDIVDNLELDSLKENIYHTAGPFTATEFLRKNGYTDVVMLVGSDRSSLLEVLKDRGFIDNTRVETRDDIDGISATRVREYARENDFINFYDSVKLGIPEKNEAKKLMKKLRLGMGLPATDKKTRRKPVKKGRLTKRAFKGWGGKRTYNSRKKRTKHIRNKKLTLKNCKCKNKVN